MNIINNEFIQLKNSGEAPIYTFHGVNDEIFDLVFDKHEKYFKIVRSENDLVYKLQCENSYRTPDLKKLLIAYRYQDEIDTHESMRNVFLYENLKIVNISTTFECYYDEKLKKDIYTTNPKYYTYLLIFNGCSTILSYNDKKYCTKAINISKNEYDYY